MAKCLYRTRSKGREWRKTATYGTPVPGASSQDWTVRLRLHGGSARPDPEERRLRTRNNGQPITAGALNPAGFTREASGTFR